MTDLLNALAAKIEFGDCWNWTAALRPGRSSTYGVVHVPGMSRNSRMRQAHRVLWEEVVGEIPEGMELDHLCPQRGDCRQVVELITFHTTDPRLKETAA